MTPAGRAGEGRCCPAVRREPREKSLSPRTTIYDAWRFGGQSVSCGMAPGREHRIAQGASPTTTCGSHPQHQSCQLLSRGIVYLHHDQLGSEQPGVAAAPLPQATATTTEVASVMTTMTRPVVQVAPSSPCMIPRCLWDTPTCQPGIRHTWACTGLTQGWALMLIHTHLMCLRHSQSAQLLWLCPCLPP